MIPTPQSPSVTAPLSGEPLRNRYVNGSPERGAAERSEAEGVAPPERGRWMRPKGADGEGF